MINQTELQKMTALIMEAAENCKDNPQGLCKLADKLIALTYCQSAVNGTD